MTLAAGATRRVSSLACRGYSLEVRSLLLLGLVACGHPAIEPDAALDGAGVVDAADDAADENS